MNFAKQIEYNRRLLVEDILRRLEAALQPLVDAVNDFFAVLFSRRLPSDWRERWRALIAEQEAAGYRIDPRSVQEYEDWIEAWARYCELLPVAETQARLNAVAASEQPPVAQRAALPRPTQTQIREQFFDQKLADAQGSLDEIKRLLDELGGRLDAARLDEEIDVDSDVERCEELIWRYNDSLISARAAWLRDDLSGEANVRLLQMLTPASFGLPLFSDEQQAQEAMRQERQISERLGQRNVTMDRVVAGLEWTNVAVTVAGIVAGGGTLVTVFNEGGKWAVAKALAVATAAAAAEQGVEAGLRAAGANKETIRGARLAAAIIAFILLRRKNRAANETTVTPSPPQPHAPVKPPTAKVSPQSDPPITAPEPPVASSSRGAPLTQQPSKPPHGQSAQDPLHSELPRTKSSPRATQESHGPSKSIGDPSVGISGVSTKYWIKSIDFKGVRVYQRDDWIDPLRRDSQGRTSLERMKKGFAPIGPDGDTMNLHHLLQTKDSPLAEMTRQFHLEHRKTIHINPPSMPSSIDRGDFRGFREAYWVLRALDFLEGSR